MEEKPTECSVFSRSVQEVSLQLEIVESWKILGLSITNACPSVTVL